MKKDLQNKKYDNIKKRRAQTRRKVCSSNPMLNTKVKHNNNIMILNFAVNFNNYKEKILDFYGNWDFKCPFCNAIHSFSRHGIYSRNICFLENSNIIEKKLNILRLICNSCKTTHAVLPADVIPYVIYSFSCIIQILTRYFLGNQGTLSIFKQFKISFQLIYLFIKKFIDHFCPCINFLRIFLSIEIDFNSSPKSILSVINNSFDFINFQFLYLNFLNSVFLMSRRQNILSQQLHIGSYFRPPT